MARTKKKIKKVGNESFFVQFKGALKYLRESRNFIIAVVLIFFSGAVLGFAFSAELGFLDEILKGLVDKIKDLGTFDTILFILQNNLKSSLFGVILGVVLGIFPVINAMSNGLILGYVMKKVYIEDGLHEFWRILPHGVFELPAIFISLALGLRLGMFIFSRNKSEELVSRAKNAMIIFVFVVVPLLIVAAVIEGLLIMTYK